MIDIAATIDGFEQRTRSFVDEAEKELGITLTEEAKQFCLVVWQNGYEEATTDTLENKNPIIESVRKAMQR